ncbi:MAG: hypothetical protein JWN93_2232 [Hyphomicrobiales bacterium]|nr:hypothetical protein [Hyphomicrobiales bacterium]
MLVRQFLAWAHSVSPAQRAPAAGALARAFIAGGLPTDQEAEAEMALTSLLDDPSPLVRKAIADELAAAPNAPHHLVLALANDQSEVAVPILARSPRLSDSDLIDCAAVGDGAAQAAIACRARLSRPVCAALAEVGGREAALAVIVNEGALIPEFSLGRILERFADDGAVREALLGRADLSLNLRAQVADATARALSRFVVSCGWLSDERAQRAAREAREKATVILASRSAGDAHGPAALVKHLRQEGQLTAGLVLRALLSGNRSLFEAALAELSGVAPERVAGHVREWRGPGFSALFARAGLPETLAPAFRAALSAQDDAPQDPDFQARLSRTMIERVLTACEREGAATLAPVVALLRRFEAEAAREEARELSGASLREARENPAPRTFGRPTSLRTLFGAAA